MIHKIKNWLHARNVYSSTLKELNSLSDRDLTDMGISRDCVEEIAQYAAYGDSK